MPFLPGLAVVFVGILGGHGKVDQQVKTIVRGVHVTAAKLPADAVRTLTHHGATTRAIVKGLHADGVIGFELHDTTLRLVIYDADGQLKTFLDTPLTAGVLDKDDLDTLKQTIEADVSALRHEDHDEIVIDPAPAAPAPAPTPTRQPAPTPEPPAPAADPVTTDGAPAASDAVSADEVAALVADSTTAVEARVAAPNGPQLGIAASLGIGVTSRSFTAAPSAVQGYSSSAVGLVHLDGTITPSPDLSLAVVFERTLEMATPLQGGMASTAISRWEAIGGYTLVHGAIEVGARLGFGSRSFAIDSTDPSRTPDGTYNYLIAGLAAAAPLGSHLKLRGIALFEPVVSGDEPTEMALGEATRWAIDLGLALELRHGHVFARAAADYQRFAWSWDMAGARGAGGAVDGYPAGTVSLGADY